MGPPRFRRATLICLYFPLLPYTNQFVIRLLSIINVHKLYLQLHKAQGSINKKRKTYKGTNTELNIHV